MIEIHGRTLILSVKSQEKEQRARKMIENTLRGLIAER